MRTRLASVAFWSLLVAPLLFRQAPSPELSEGNSLAVPEPTRIRLSWLEGGRLVVREFALPLPHGEAPACLASFNFDTAGGM